MPRGLVHVAGSERCVLSHSGSPITDDSWDSHSKGWTYQYKVLPFGLSLAPRTFTQCMDAALSPLRLMGIRILNYLDDWLILAQSQAVLTSQKTLSQWVSFLCTVIDSVQMTVTVSEERAMTIQHHAASFKEGTTRPLKAFQKMLGLIATASLVLQLGLLHMRPIQFWLKQRVPFTASVLYSMAVLQVFQAKMLASEEAGLDAASLRDLRSMTVLALHATKATAQTIGRSMSSLIVLEHYLCLTMMEMKEVNKVPFLDALVLSGNLYGPAVESFAECFTKAQKLSQALRHFLPKRTSSSAASSRPRPAPT